ncbi:MAG: HTH domain-containing protein [Cetobacterium sp.]|uniref:HTH domain-containing protein n=1 Tax=Cetobacterium sp. TaxID=2071632 RepID=UPI003EE5F83C
MTNTAKILLKILLNGNLHQNDLERYLDLDLNSIKKNLKILDNYLLSNRLGTIKRYKDIYTLEKFNKNLIISLVELDILSSKDRQDILCIKLLLNGKLNLEKIKEELNISRTTLQKDLKDLKEYLKQSGIEVESKHFKGIFIQRNQSVIIKHILCEKIMRLFIGKEYLTKYQIKLLKEIDTLNDFDFFEIFSEITKEFKIGKFNITFYALYSMKCIENLDNSFIYEGDIFQTHSEYYNILKKLEKMKLDLSFEFKKFVAVIILKALYFPMFDLNLKNSFNIFIETLEKNLELELHEKRKLIKLLIKKYQIGYLNKKYDLFWIRSKTKSNLQIQFGNIIQNMIEKTNIQMMYGDILGISDVILDFYIEKEYSKKLKLLFIVQNIEGIESSHYKKVFSHIQIFYPKAEIFIETILDLKFGVIKEIEEYDLVISEFENIDFKNSKKLCSLNIQEIQSMISEIILLKILNKFNKYIIET